MKRVRLVLPLLVLFMLAACATGPSMKPEDILYRAESLYNAQHVDYMSYFSYDAANGSWEVHPWVSDEEKEILRTRKEVLGKFKSAILVYRAFVKRGDPPSYEAEQELTSFIRQFQRGM